MSMITPSDRGFDPLSAAERRRYDNARAADAARHAESAARHAAAEIDYRGNPINRTTTPRTASPATSSSTGNS